MVVVDVCVSCSILSLHAAGRQHRAPRCPEHCRPRRQRAHAAMSERAELSSACKPRRHPHLFSRILTILSRSRLQYLQVSACFFPSHAYDMPYRGTASSPLHAERCEPNQPQNGREASPPTVYLVPRNSCKFLHAFSLLML